MQRAIDVLKSVPWLPRGIDNMGSSMRQVDTELSYLQNIMANRLLALLHHS